jgi:hypothetical protein
MPVSLIDADSLLAVDVGTITTRATLFDVVEGHYRFIASGQAPTTAAAPFRDLGEGVNRAIANLQAITGRTFLNAEHQLIVPVQDGAGVGSFAATISAGPAVKTVLVGLLNDVSLESIQRLARTSYARVVETIGLNDPRKPEQQVDSIIRLTPELILVAGGTDGGATRSVEKLIEIIGMICYLLPQEKRPAVLYAGNQAITTHVKDTLQSLTASLTVAPNVRPALEIEDLQPAQRLLSDLLIRIRAGQMKGVDELTSWSGGAVLPTASAHGRMIRFLSEVYGAKRGILGVDIGASHVSVAAGFGGALTTGVHPHLGLGESLANILRYTSLEDIMRWLPLDLSPEMVRDYLYQKSFYPATLPAVVEDLAIEQALARQLLHIAMKSAEADFPPGINRPAAGLMPVFDPIMASGSVITRAPTLGQSLLILLDAIQPVGVTNVILDQNNLLPALGAAAARIPILPIQVLESGAFLGLATVVTPVVTAKAGTPVLRVWVTYANGNQSQVEVKQGGFEILPLTTGQSGKLTLQPLHHADVGYGPGRANEITISGTVLGVVIDARGRPLRLPADQNRRRELLKKWLWTVGG